LNDIFPEKEINMKAVIFCGGQGTRIRDASEVLPKPMLSIGGKPILWHIMKMYSVAGINEFVLCLGYKGWVIKEFFLNYKAMTTDFTLDLSKPETLYFHNSHEENWKITFAETGELTSTGGRVAAIRKYVEDDEFFHLTYGDGVSSVDIKKLEDFHKKHGKVATVTAVRPPGRFGEMGLSGNNVLEFNEKPSSTEGFINGGFFVCDSKKIWNYLNNDPSQTFEREPVQQLTNDGQLKAFLHKGFWQPMDTLREFTMLNEMWSAGNPPWKKW
jgi:glucose-1-phosphate cytidylyltransferase